MAKTAATSVSNSVAEKRERAAYEAGLREGQRRASRERDRAAFEANLAAGQRVYLRHAYLENNQPSGEQVYAAPGTRGKIDLIESHPNGPLYNVAFRARVTLNGEEKTRPKCRPLSASALCASKKEAQVG